MRVVGVDLAAQPENTAACVIDWGEDGTAVVAQLVESVTDDRFDTLVADADKVGIDAPFGWPDAFVTAVQGHHEGREWPLTEARQLRLRHTDLYAWEQTGAQPLSVSADKIAAAAFRAARLLSGRAVDRTGGGKFVEVYPRAARDRLGIDGDWSMYTLRRWLPSLSISDEDADLCDRSEHCFDALIAALAARASALGLCDPVPPHLVDTVRREGWIALPWPGAGDLLSGEHPATTFESWGRWSHASVAGLTRELVAQGIIAPPVNIEIDEQSRQWYVDDPVPDFIATAGDERRRVALAFYDDRIAVGVWRTAWNGQRPYPTMTIVGSIALDDASVLPDVAALDVLAKTARRRRAALYRTCSDCGRSVAAEHRLRLDGREVCHSCAERGHGIVF